MSTVYLITGASRGLGRAWVETYLSRPNNTVIAAVRDPNAATSKSLETLKTGSNSKLITIKIDSASETDAADAIKNLQAQGISHLDVVIANAGIATSLTPLSQTPLSEFKHVLAVNSIAPLLLFQATFPLLNKSSKPIFIGVGSAMGTITAMEQRPYPSGGYGPSKAMLHFLIRKIHFENENLIAFVADPG
jgi:norsolorinic acid ketoreductase